MSETRPSGADSAIAMKSGGYYSSRTKGAKDVIDNAAPLVLAAAAELPLTPLPQAPLPLTPGASINLADFGAADGGTSMELMGRLNDFSQVFRNAQGVGTAGPGLTGIEALYVFASGTSFYNQILPADSLDLGFSATAMHWMSRTPGVISNHVHAVGAEGTELTAYAAQGRDDWQTILCHRARELKPGGRLVLVNFCRDEAGRYLGHTAGIDMFDSFNRLWTALRDDGTINQAEYRNTNFPQFYRTPEEFAAPLRDRQGPVHQAGLRLTHLETRVVPCPYAEEFRRSGDLENFAPTYIGTLRSWSETVFLGGLDAARPLTERQAIVERFYQSYEDLVRADPRGHAMDYVHAYMVIAKV
jgi:hypothetical protein